MRIRSALRLLLVPVLVLALGAGCGTEPEPKPQPPAGLQPANDSPKNTILRFVAAYEAKKTAECQALFAGDFTFEFSNSADPALANEWVAGWFASDESVYVKNLFQGGANLDGMYQEPASSIDLIIGATEPIEDADSGDPTRSYVLATRVDGAFTVSPTPPATDPTRYVVTNNSHRFFLVRGDAAVGLKASQPADSVHWYIWKWRDETAGLTSMPSALGRESRTATWGALKAVYR